MLLQQLLGLFSLFRYNETSIFQNKLDKEVKILYSVLISSLNRFPEWRNR